MSKRIQIYGVFSDHFSIGTVSRGLAAGLAHYAIEPIVHDVHNLTARNVPPNCSVGRDLAAPAIAVGYPDLVEEWLRQHKHRIGYYITESLSVPDSWRTLSNRNLKTCVPSRWVAQAFEPAFTAVVPHGLAVEYCRVLPPPAKRPSEQIRFVHFAGGGDAAARKGTHELIDAFVQVFGTHPIGNLRLVVDGTRPLPDVVYDAKYKSIFTVDASTDSRPPKDMIRFLQGHDAVIQPSRAEGFGLIPLEARACGVPVIATGCTGHIGHVVIGLDTLIGTGAPRPLTVQGISAGTAPAVPAESIVTALRAFTENFEHNRAAAAAHMLGYYEKWSWPMVVEPLARWFLQHSFD